MKTVLYHSARKITPARSYAWMASGLLIMLSFIFPLGVEVRLTPILMLEAVLVLFAAAFFAIGWTKRLDGGRLWIGLVLVSVGAAIMIYLVHRPGIAGEAGWSFWLKVLGIWLAAWMATEQMAAYTPQTATGRSLFSIAIPVIFGTFLFLIWEWVTVGLGVPLILLPPPSVIGKALVDFAPTLVDDFVQTFIKAVLTGWVMGSTAGFLVAIAADRIPFLKRGLLPFGNVVSALPIIGVAPIMVMWFGSDWQSKAAVVVTMTFFPMLVNTVAGLSAAGALERDLMRSYGAGYGPTLLKLRLPAAMPFIFNALKINSTLALIGAIVAEFFGSPIYGMGFRITTQAGRMALDTVWAEIAVAAVAGSAFYGLVALVERRVTFWHPSYRRV